MLAFTTAVIFLMITPGPGVLSTAGVGAGYGGRPGLHYVGGLFAGNNIVVLLVVTGIAAAVLALPYARPVLFAASLCYLLYLAAKIAFAGSRLAFIHSETPPGFSGGLALQLINPKCYLVNAAIFSGFAFWPENLVGEAIVKFAILNLVWIPVHFLWLYAGIFLNRLDLGRGMQTAINAAMATAMLAVVAIAAFSAMRDGL